MHRSFPRRRNRTAQLCRRRSGGSAPFFLTGATIVLRGAKGDALCAREPREGSGSQRTRAQRGRRLGAPGAPTRSEGEPKGEQARTPRSAASPRPSEGRGEPEGTGHPKGQGRYGARLDPCPLGGAVHWRRGGKRPGAAGGGRERARPAPPPQRRSPWRAGKEAATERAASRRERIPLKSCACARQRHRSGGALSPPCEDAAECSRCVAAHQHERTLYVAARLIGGDAKRAQPPTGGDASCGGDSIT